MCVTDSHGLSGVGLMVSVGRWRHYCSRTVPVSTSPTPYRTPNFFSILPFLPGHVDAHVSLPEPHRKHVKNDSGGTVPVPWAQIRSHVLRCVHIQAGDTQDGAP
jgi:hypothetical protein